MAETEKNLLGSVLKPASSPETSGKEGGVSGLSRKAERTGGRKVHEVASGSAGSSSRSQEQEAREIIEDIKKGKESREKRIKNIKSGVELSQTPRDSAQEALRTAYAADSAIEKELSWLIPSSNIDTIQSVDVLEFCRDLAGDKTLRENPDLLSVRTLKLVYATVSSPESARKEVSGVVQSVRNRISAMTSGAEKSKALGTFDVLLYGKPLSEDFLVEDNVYNRDKKEEESITDPDLILLLEEINYNLEIDPEYMKTTSRLEKDRERILQTARRLEISSQQTREAIRRINERIGKANENEKKMRVQEALKGGDVIRWGDIEGRFTYKEKDLHPNDEHFALPGFSKREIELLTSGHDGIREWFSEFVSGIYGVGREHQQPELPDFTKFNKFEELLDWIYGPRSEAVKMPFKFAWSDRGKQEIVLKTLAYSPGKIEDKLNTFRRLLGADLDYYANYNSLASKAINFYQDAIPNLLAQKQGFYDETLTYLRQTVSPDEMPAWMKQDLKGRAINYDEFYVLLRKGQAEGKFAVSDNQTKEQVDNLKKMMEGLRQKVDVVGYGVCLLDSDVLVYSEAYQQWSVLQEKYLELKSKPEDSLTPEEQTLFERLPKEIRKKSDLCAKLKERDINGSGRSDDAVAEDTELLERYRNYSPLEAEVRDNLIQYYKALGIEAKEWEVRDAIWAARMHLIGTGRMVDLNSYMVTRPKNVNLKSFEYDKGKYTMISPFMEDIQRIINPELFGYRFTVGGTPGEKLFNLLRTHNLKERSGKKGKIDWKELERDLGSDADAEQKKTLELMKIAEQNMGVSFTELLGAGFLSGGVYFDGTVWRIEAGLYDEIRQDFLASGKSPEAWENQAMGIQLLIAKDDRERMMILKKMIKREPLVFMQYLAGKTANEIYAQNRLSQEDVKILHRALSMAQMRILNDEALLTREIDLGKGSDGHGNSDFREIVKPFLEQLGVTAPKQEAYHAVIGQMQEAAKKFLPEWAKGNMSLTLTLSDIDWSKSYFAKLGTAAMDRRGRDMMAMAQTRDILFEIFSTGSIYSPKKPEDMLKKLMEFEKAAGNYLPLSGSEKATQKILRTILLFNENRAALRSPIGYIPGLTWAFKQIGEIELEHFGLMKFIVGKEPWENFLKNNKGGKFLDRLPKTLAEAVSLSVGTMGPEGNAWDEFKIAWIIDEARAMGMFNQNPGLAGELKREFHATLFHRFSVGIPRKYFWVAIVATIALAASQSIEEEKKQK